VHKNGIYLSNFN